MLVPARRFPFVVAVALAVLVATAARTYPSDTAPAVSFVVVDPLTPSTVYAATSVGLYKTVDAGEQWTWISPALLDLHALVIDPLVPTTLYAASSSFGVFRSTDGGSTWTPIGVSYWWVNTLAVDPQTGRLYAAIDSGVFTWEPTDGSWSQIFGVQWPPAEWAWVYSVAVRGSAIYIGVFYGDYETGTVAVYTGPYNWAVLSTYPPTDAIPVDVLAIGPANPSIAYAGVHNDSLFKTTDGGATWSRTSVSGVYLVVIDPRDPNTVYAANYWGVAKSSDGGNTWTSAGAGLIDTLLAYGVGTAVALAIDPLTPDTLYAGTAIGMFKTTDGGMHWAPSGLNQQSPLGSLTVAPTTVLSGSPAAGNVTLTAAQTADVSIVLSTSDPARATVPPSVTVPAGATSATFTVTANQVFTTASVSIRASLGDATRSADLWVYAQTNVREVRVDRSVIGGNPAAGRVFLTRTPGSTEAIAVTLASNSNAAAVPPTVIVPADAEVADFTITTTAVGAATPVTITATYRRTASAVITVNPRPPVAELASLTLNPTSVYAGTSSTAIVRLTMGAPAGGASITLSSVQQPAGTAGLPSSVTVPQGATSATFTVTTVKCRPGAATILATYTGTTKSAALAVTTSPDGVTIQRARYQPRQRTLIIDATSTDWNATLDAYVWSGGQVGPHIGTLTNQRRGSYHGQFTWPTYPRTVIVTSSSCGSATAGVGELLMK